MPGTTDTVKTILTPGEFVVRKEAVDMIGVPMLNMINNMPEKGGHSNIDKLIEMATTENMKGMYGGGMVKAGPKPMGHGGMVDAYRGGGMVMDQYGHGGMVKNKMMSYGHGGMVKDKMMMMEKGGQLKPVPEDNPGLGKLPEMVRNRMGYMQEGGMVDDSLMGMRYGGMAKKKKKMMGYGKGGPIKGASPYSANISPEGEFQQIMSVPASEVGGGEGLRFYLGEAIKPQRALAKRTAQDRAMVKMATTPQDSIPAAMIANYFSEEQPQAKKRGLRALLGMQDGGPVEESNFVEEGIPLPPQPKDPLQIGPRQADPSMYEGSTLGAMRDQAMMLENSIQQDTVNRARKTLQLMRLKGMLGNAEMLDSPTGNPVLDREKQMREMQLREMFGNFPE